MEYTNTRETRKQGRRHDALRRTLRRQGVAVVDYEQVGGARSDTVTLQKLQAAFRATGIQVTDTEFAFLADDDWFNKPEAARNYMTLIGKQDVFFGLALKQVHTNLGLSPKSTDTEIMTKITSLTNADAKKNLDVIKACLNLVILTDFVNIKASGATAAGDKCHSTIKTKFDYNLYRDNTIPILNTYCATCATDLTTGSEESATKENIYNLATILLHPLLLRNTSILAIVNILQTLIKDEESIDLIGKERGDTTINSFSSIFLIEKFISHIYSTAYQMVSDVPRDSLFLWGCLLSSTFWEYFFTHFLNSVRNGSESFTESLAALSSGTAVLTSTVKLQLSSNAKRFGMITGLVYKNQDKSVQEILALFAGEESITPTIPAATARKTATARAAASQAVNPADVMTGMLPSIAWNQPLFPSTSAEGVAASSSSAAPAPAPAENSLTFGRLLKRLSVTELHFLIHLVHVLKEQPGPGAKGEEPTGVGSAASTTGGAAGGT